MGQRFISAVHALDEAQIKSFAAQFDPQVFHLDAEACKDTFFAGLAASGWHTAAITMSLLVRSGMPIAGGPDRRGLRTDLAAPDPARRYPSSIERSAGGDSVALPAGARHDYPQSETLNQQGEAVQILTSRMLAWRRPL